MSEYRHHVSGFFARRDEAEDVISILVERGLPRERLQLLAAESTESAPAPEAGSKEVLKDVLVDGAIGTAVGTGIGELAEIALVAANVSLFVASPLIAPLAMLGWGASLGGLIGAAAGAEGKEGGFSALVGACRRCDLERPGRAAGANPDGARNDDRTRSHPGGVRPRIQGREHGVNDVIPPA